MNLAPWRWAGCFLVWLLLNAAAARGEVVLSEFMAANDHVLADENGDFSDWIELFNAGNQPENLDGWYLTDSPDHLTKWRLPAEILLPQKHRIVFASNKDRALAGLPLHTNFRLASSGGYVALIKPDGFTVASAFGPGYPRQFPDISYGLAVVAEETPLITRQAPVRLLVPANDLLELNWFLPDTDDSAWLPVTNGIGFETVRNSPEASVIADSLADFSDQQGQHQWYYGFYDRTADAIVGYTTNDFTAFPRSTAAFGPDNAWTGTEWRYSQRTPPSTTVGAATMRPNGSASGGLEQWALRRWISPVSGSIRVAVEFAKETAGGGGVTLRMYRKGVVGQTLTIGGADLTGTNVVSEVTVAAGDILDFAVLAQGLSGDATDVGDLAHLRVVISQLSSLDAEINTDISAQMAGRNATAWLRIPFSNDAPGSFERLLLRLRADDGFIAYLNGIEVASANAPALPHWNSTATATTSDAAAIQPVEFDLTSRLGLLQPGANLLAIHALNASADDADLLCTAELIARTVRLDTKSALYFSPATPGNFNGAGNTNLGPLITATTFLPAVPTTNDDITVTARITKTFQKLGTIQLNWRIMYSNIVATPMLDDGLHGDGAAGDGVYGARIPGKTANAGQMVRWYVSAADTSGNQTRFPAFSNRLRSPEFEGTVVADPSLTNPLPVLHFFVQSPSAADSASTRCSIAYNGEFYDNVIVSVHGQSSKEFPKHSYNFDMNPGSRFQYDSQEDRVDDFNILTTYPDKAKVRNILAYETYRDAGHAYHKVIPLRVQRNATFLGDFNFVEDGSENFLKRVGLNPNGALYKMYSTSLVGAGASEKKTRKWENNADIITLNQGVLGRLGNKRNYLYDRVDIPGMVNFLATMIITGGVDCCHKNFYFYHDTDTDLWHALPWDLDLTFGRNWTGTLTYYDDKMYFDNGLSVGNNEDLMAVLFSDSVFNQMYNRRIRTLMDKLLQPTNTPVELRHYETRIHELMPILTPDATLDLAKWKPWGIRQTMGQAVDLMLTNYFPARRKYLYAQSGTGRPIPVAQPADASVQFGTFEATPASGISGEEFVQIVNTNKFAVDISDWQLTGDIAHVFHAGTVIPANGSLYVSPDINTFRRRVASPRGGQGLNVQNGYHGQLSARGGTVQLLDGVREVARLILPANPTPAQRYLRISEILFNSPIGAGTVGNATDGAQFIELLNTGPVTLDLTEVRLTDGVEFSFAGSAITTLGPGQRVVVVRDAAAFAARYGNKIPVAGQFLGRLDPDGEAIRLLDHGEVVLDFAYDSKWEAKTRGAGHSLIVIAEDADWTAWKDASQWKAGRVPGGTPGLSDATYGAWLTRYYSSAQLTDPAVGPLFANPDGDAFDNYSEFLAGTHPGDPASPLKIEARAAGQPGNVEIHFHAVANRSYSIEYRTALGETTWTPLTIVPAGSSREIVIPDTTPNESGRFYRVTVSPLH